MRRLFRIFIFFVIPVILGAEVPLPPSEFAKLSLADAAKAVDAPEVNHTLRTAYAAAAIESKRSDLVTFCFENPLMDTSFDYAVSKLPDSPYKEEVMLMMLRGDSPFWDRLRYLMRYPGHLNIDKTSAPFRALIKKYLPNLPIDDGLISTRETRSKLADKIEGVRNPKLQGQVELKEKAVALPEASQPLAPAPPTTPATAPAPLPPRSAVAENHAPNERQAPVWPWVFGSAVALLVIIGLALKRHS